MAVGFKAHKTERKSSEVPLPKQSTSALSLKGKSPKQTSSSSQLSHDAQKSKEDSFWSSFLGSETSENSKATKSKNSHSKSDVLGSRVNVKVSDQKDCDHKTAVPTPGQGSGNTTSKELELSLNNEKVKKDVKNKHDKTQGISRRKKQMIGKDFCQKPSMTSAAQNRTEENEKSNKNPAELKTNTINTNTINDTKATLDEYEKLDNELSSETGINCVSIGLESQAQQKSKDMVSENDNSDGSTVSVELPQAMILGQGNVEHIRTNETQIERKKKLFDTNKKESDEVTHSSESVKTAHAILIMSKWDQKEEVSVDKKQGVEGHQKLFKDQEKGNKASSELPLETFDGSAVSIELTEALACKESNDLTASNSKQCQHEMKANHEQSKELDGPLAHSTPNREAKRRVKEEEDKTVSLCPDRRDGSAVSIELAESISCTGKSERNEQDPRNLSEASSVKEMSEEQLLGKTNSSSNEGNL